MWLRQRDAQHSKNIYTRSSLEKQILFFLSDQIVKCIYQVQARPNAPILF